MSSSYASIQAYEQEHVIIGEDEFQESVPSTLKLAKPLCLVGGYDDDDDDDAEGGDDVDVDDGGDDDIDSSDCSSATIDEHIDQELNEGTSYHPAAVKDESSSKDNTIDSSANECSDELPSSPATQHASESATKDDQASSSKNKMPFEQLSAAAASHQDSKQKNTKKTVIQKGRFTIYTDSDAKESDSINAVKDESSSKYNTLDYSSNKCSNELPSSHAAQHASESPRKMIMQAVARTRYHLRSAASSHQDSLHQGSAAASYQDSSQKNVRKTVVKKERFTITSIDDEKKSDSN